MTFDDASVHGQVRQVQARDPVVGFQADLFEVLENARGDPFVAAPPDVGRRALRVGNLLVGGPEHEDLEQFLEHGPVRDPRPVALQRVGIRHRRD